MRPHPAAAQGQEALRRHHLPARIDAVAPAGITGIEGIAAANATADLGNGWSEYSLSLDPGVDAGDVLQRCTASGLPLRRFEERRATLHDVFVHLVGSAPDSSGELAR